MRNDLSPHKFGSTLQDTSSAKDILRLNFKVEILEGKLKIAVQEKRYAERERDEFKYLYETKPQDETSKNSESLNNSNLRHCSELEQKINTLMESNERYRKELIIADAARREGEVALDASKKENIHLKNHIEKLSAQLYTLEKMAENYEERKREITGDDKTYVREDDTNRYLSFDVNH